MRVTIDRAGRMVVPKVLRERLRLEPGAELDARVEGGRLVATPLGRPDIVLVEEDGRLVATTTEPVHELTQEELLGLLDEEREWPHRS